MTHTDGSPLRWRKSSYSTNGGNCLEVGEGVRHAVPVRDSKNPSNAALVFNSAEWDAFVQSVKRGALAD